MTEKSLLLYCAGVMIGLIMDNFVVLAPYLQVRIRDDEEDCCQKNEKVRITTCCHVVNL